MAVSESRLPAPLAKLDAFQQRHTALAVPFAVYKKFSDDDAGKLASLVAYYSFISVFPLLIVLTTVVSRVLVGYPELAEQIVKTAAGSFLDVSGQTGEIKPLQLNGLALVIAIGVALWAGLGVAHEMQYSMNVVYGVSRRKRPGFFPRMLRSFLLLIIVGLGLSITSIIQGAIVQVFGGILIRVVAGLLVLLLNTMIFVVAFQRSTVAKTPWRNVLPGAAVVSLFWSLMQLFGANLLGAKVDSSQATYGQFAIVIALLFYFFLLAQVTLYCAELNVVLQHKLWPRGYDSDPIEFSQEEDPQKEKATKAVDPEWPG